MTNMLVKEERSAVENGGAEHGFQRIAGRQQSDYDMSAFEGKGGR